MYYFIHHCYQCINAAADHQTAEVIKADPGHEPGTSGYCQEVQEQKRPGIHDEDAGRTAGRVCKIRYFSNGKLSANADSDADSVCNVSGYMESTCLCKECIQYVYRTGI